MTVSNQTTRVVALGNGATTEFDFDFTWVSEDTIVVTYTDEDGLETTLSASEYDLDLNPATGDSLWGEGGTVTYPLAGSAIATDTFLTIYRDIPYEQEVTISNQGPFYPQTVERMGDILDMQIQQLTAADETAAAAATAAEAAAAAAALYAQQIVETFTDGVDYTAGSSTTIVIEDITFPSKQYLLILRNGVVPYAQADFSISNNGTDTTVTFGAAIASDVLTIEVYYGLRASSPTGLIGSVTGTAGEITATAGPDVVLSLPATLVFTGKNITDGTFNNPTLTSAQLGTPDSGTLTNCTGYPSSGLSGVVPATLGGTGIANNVASTLTISGSFATTLTVTAGTSITLPTTGTLSTLAGVEEFTNKTLNASVAKGTWTTSGTWTVPAHTLNGTISGGGNQINNVIVGTSTPLAGFFTTLSAQSLATSAASPLLLTNGQLVTVALTSQTVGGTTLTIPDFASVVDEFTFKTKSQTMANKTLTAPVINGVVTTSGLTLPAFTLGGTIAGGGNQLNNIIIGTTTPLAGSFTALTSTSLTVTNVLNALSTGEVTMPLQPAFLARKSATTNNVTGNGTVYTVIFDVEIFDQGADYNNASGVFTAPVTGRYLFYAVLRGGTGVLADTFDIKIVTSNRSYDKSLQFTNMGTITGGEYLLEITALADMDSADTAYIALTITGEGADTESLYGSADPLIYFCGHLAC